MRSRDKYESALDPGQVRSPFLATTIPTVDQISNYLFSFLSSTRLVDASRRDKGVFQIRGFFLSPLVFWGSIPLVVDFALLLGMAGTGLLSRS